MDVTTRTQRSVPPAPAAAPSAIVKAAGAWVGQFGRTLKTCRLYDPNNPTVVRFREELATALQRLLDEHGPLTLRFTSDDVLLDEASLHPARSRDDNLALPFYRDGLRALTLSPGIEARELETVLDAVLQVTGQNLGEDDLVTLLWQAHLPHVDVDNVPGQGDFGTGEAIDGGGDDAMPWPAPAVEPGVETTASPVTVAEEGEAEQAGRSDDWATSSSTVEVEAGFDELDSLAPHVVKRFGEEFEAEHGVSAVTTALAVLRAAIAAGSSAEDRVELGQFIPRLLRTSIAGGVWLEAREALLMLRQCGGADWSAETFVQELMQPISISGVVEHLDKQDPGAVQEFVVLARELGDPAVDWLTQVLAESQQRRTRRTLAEAIAEVCRDNPERLASWLSDPRWFVVRNVIHILGWIGGKGIVGMLQTAVRHEDARVRQEVLGALGQIEPRAARPLLLKLLERADTRIFSAVLHQLSAEREPAVARLVMGYLQDPLFEQRPPEDKRAIYGAIGSCAGDEVIPDLENELLKGNWFARHQENHRQAVARCIARIGTPYARMVLERGVASRRGPVRAACEAGLAAWTVRDV
jgi:HEAT repeat protein